MKKYKVKTQKYDFFVETFDIENFKETFFGEILLVEEVKC